MARMRNKHTGVVVNVPDTRDLGGQWESADTEQKAAKPAAKTETSSRSKPAAKADK